MEKIAFIFPGQGSQYKGMGRDFFVEYEFVQDIFKESSNILGFDASKLCFEGEEAELQQTKYTQPLIFLVSWVCFEILQKEGIKPDIVAGHSLGEYTAVCASLALSFKDGLYLVKKRAEFMQEAAQKYPGTMGAIIGLDKEKIEEIIKETSLEDRVVIANYNSPQQIVVSGTVDGVEKVTNLAKERGAKLSVILKVGGAFHSPFMEEASNRLKVEIEKMEFQDAKIPIVANVSGECIYRAEDIKDSLIKQMTSSVLWTDCVKKMVSEGVSLFIEVGPGKVLSGLVRRIVPNVKVLNVEDKRSLEETVKFIKNKGVES